MDFENDDPELALSIPIKAIYEEFYCPICFGVISNCHMTQCGHNFCYDCILKCLNLKHNCPFCNKDCVVASLVKNHHFDKLIETFTEQKELASKKYFEKFLKKPNIQLTQSQELALNSSSNNNVAGGGGGVGGNDLSPIEVIFHKHMKRSLLAYQDYYNDIYSKFQATSQSIHSDFVSKMANHTSKYEKRLRQREKNKKPIGDLEEKHAKKISKYQKQIDDKIASLQSSFDQSIQILLNLYDQYMQNFAPAREFLPVVISISIPSKNIVWKKITISPTDSISDVKLMIERLLAESKNPLLSSNVWSSKLITFSLKLAMSGEEVIISDEYRPIIQYDAQPGSELIIKGDIQLESDKPKSCFTVTFHKGAIVDYYRCKDCNINWICKECAENCHKNHTIMEHIKQHKPTWNCCYCVKNKKCIILNKTQKATE